MALTSAELQEMADLSNELGDEQGELEALTQLESTGALGGAQQPDFPGAAIIEPIAAVATAIPATIAGGLAGIGAIPFQGEEAGETVRAVQEAGTFQPRTEAGRAGLETLGDLVQKGIDIVNIPLSGIGGILELVSGQGLDQAVETIRAIQGQGVSRTAGERVFEETGSPLAATIAETAPEAVATVLGTKGAGRALEAAQRGTRATGAALTPAVQAGRETAEALFKVQSPTKQRIARLIEGGSTDVETAKFKLDAPAKGAAQAAPQLPTPPQTKLQEFLNVGGPRVKTDRVAVDAINQGFDEGVIAAVKGATPADKLKMQEMVNIMERGKANKLFAAKNRPSDVAGNTLLDRVKVIRDANKTSGKEIDRVAKGLKGQQVDVLDAVTDFGEALDNLGVQLVPNGKGGFTPSFELSQLGPGDRGPIKEVIRQMNIKSRGGIDALDVHTMKRIIDNNVTFGKVKTGISGDGERVLKGFRRALDKSLDDNFPAYNQANTVYAETINALDSIQDVAGRKMDLSGGNADKALGTLLRRTLSNQQSRIRLIDSIDEIESVAKKHGGGRLRIEGPGLGQDDLLTQVLFVDELDSVFGPVARTSFQGQIDQALKQGVSATTTQAGAIDAVVVAVGKVAEKARGINEAGAFKAIKELLKGQ
jgi:hypothetical protein